MTIKYKENGNVEFSPSSLRDLVRNRVKHKICNDCRGRGSYIVHIDEYMSVQEICEVCKGLGAKLIP